MSQKIQVKFRADFSPELVDVLWQTDGTVTRDSNDRAFVTLTQLKDGKPKNGYDRLAWVEDLRTLDGTPLSETLATA